MAKRKPKIIKEPKPRGEWVEAVFMARANEYELPVSRPWGDSNLFDFVVGRGGRFASVQVKSTIVKCGGGYLCSVKRNNKPYAPGSFDFLAAYVIPEDVWYIIPASKIADKESVILCSVAAQAQYEAYRERWALLWEVSGTESVAAEPVETPAAGATPEARFPRNAMERMEAAFGFFRRHVEGNSPRPQKTDDKG
jgi:hypothetical protein